MVLVAHCNNKKKFFLYFLFSAHPSKTHGSESRPELVLKLTLDSLAVSVLHIDPLPAPDAAPSPLHPIAAHFFSIVGPGQLSSTAFLQSRAVFNQACPHDHLRCSSQMFFSLYFPVLVLICCFNFCKACERLKLKKMMALFSQICGPGCEGDL